MASSLYEPLLHGIVVDETPFSLICPLAKFSNPEDCLIIDYEQLQDAMGDFLGYNVFGVSPGAGWGYMGICAAVGIAALALSLVLYRRRKLECAGDFVAFKALEPVATVLATLFVSGFFHGCFRFYNRIWGFLHRDFLCGSGIVVLGLVFDGKFDVLLHYRDILLGFGGSFLH